MWQRMRMLYVVIVGAAGCLLVGTHSKTVAVRKHGFLTLQEASAPVNPMTQDTIASRSISLGGRSMFKLRKCMLDIGSVLYIET
jgi:hypothetical protein